MSKGKFVKSTDPAKKVVLGLLKEASGANKVTDVRLLEENVYSGNCFKHLGNRQYESLGRYTVELPEEVEEALETEGEAVNV